MKGYLTILFAIGAVINSFVLAWLSSMHNVWFATWWYNTALGWVGFLTFTCGTTAIIRFLMWLDPMMCDDK
jgi:hypothetical protein